MEQTSPNIYKEKFAQIRAAAKGISEAVEHLEGSPWYPAMDHSFWENLSAIEKIGSERDKEKAAWLSEFIIVDDLGPLGRGMLLSQAALTAFTQMPEVTGEIAHQVVATFSEQTSVSKKIGLRKLVEVSASRALP